jgi:hypothetical protein
MSACEAKNGELEGKSIVRGKNSQNESGKQLFIHFDGGFKISNQTKAR